MTEVRETKLPGVGVRHDFTAEVGNDVGVIVHHDGRREILSYGGDDPDACASLITLSEHDTQTLAEILGISHVSETVAEVRQAVEGLTIEWFDVVTGCVLEGSTVSTALQGITTDASVVAVIQEGTPVPNPGDGFVLAAGDVAVVVGESDALAEIRSALGM